MYLGNFIPPISDYISQCDFKSHNVTYNFTVWLFLILRVGYVQQLAHYADIRGLNLVG